LKYKNLNVSFLQWFTIKNVMWSREKAKQKNKQTKNKKQTNKQTNKHTNKQTFKSPQGKTIFKIVLGKNL